jgi:hypothetical protein
LIIEIAKKVRFYAQGIHNFQLSRLDSSLVKTPWHQMAESHNGCSHTDAESLSPRQSQPYVHPMDHPTTQAILVCKELRMETLSPVCL